MRGLASGRAVKGKARAVSEVWSGRVPILVPALILTT